LIIVAGRAVPVLRRGDERKHERPSVVHFLHLGVAFRMNGVVQMLYAPAPNGRAEATSKEAGCVQSSCCCWPPRSAG
jgi:hypothetical protein